jgi:hypothetical protein
VGLARAAVMSRSDGLVGEGDVGILFGATSCVIGIGSGSVLADRESRPPHCDMKDKTVKEIAVSTCSKRMGVPCKFTRHDSGEMSTVQVAHASATYHDGETFCQSIDRL